MFDRRAKLLQSERAANNPDVDNYDFLKEEIGYRLQIFRAAILEFICLNLLCTLRHKTKEEKLMYNYHKQNETFSRIKLLVKSNRVLITFRSTNERMCL